jgi:hypothetical protein
LLQIARFPPDSSPASYKVKRLNSSYVTAKGSNEIKRTKATKISEEPKGLGSTHPIRPSEQSVFCFPAQIHGFRTRPFVYSRPIRGRHFPNLPIPNIPIYQCNNLPAPHPSKPPPKNIGVLGADLHPILIRPMARPRFFWPSTLLWLFVQFIDYQIGLRFSP